ncbi:hypothetical protein SAMN05428966_114120 [Massilia sp. PDC64]|nr:hypothetical protein [Massilia sp. PDC64]SDF32594.1 hypothetical protein SAMN05428966_114120 [Massilia sp. PDC64]
MNKTAISLVLGATLVASLSACSSKTSANEENFGNAVSQYFDKKGDLCLDPIKWPVDVYEIDFRQQKLYPDNAAGQMSALESVGLAKGEDVELPGTFVDGKPLGAKVKVRRYTMTDAAKPYLHAKPGKQPRICWGRKSLSKVIRWADPTKVDDHEESSVIYTYKLSNVADWARKPQVKEAFPELGRNVDGERSQKEKLYVKLTPNGWEAFGLND